MTDRALALEVLQQWAPEIASFDNFAQRENILDAMLEFRRRYPRTSASESAPTDAANKKEGVE